MNEIWKDVIGFEDAYQISTLGRCRTKERRVSNHTGFLNLKPRFIAHASRRHGYQFYALSKNNEVKRVSVHRLLAIHFIANPNNYPEINHIDGNKKNFTLSNLEWCTRSQNIRHADRTGLRNVSGGDSYSAKLNELQVRIIRKLRGELTQRKIAKIFNVAHGTIGQIQRNEAWITEHSKEAIEQGYSYSRITKTV